MASRPFLALLALIGAGALHAETLTDAWRTALEGDRTLQAVRLDTQAAAAEASAARAQRLPTVTASASFMQFEDAPAFDFSATGLPIQMPDIFDRDRTSLGSVTISVPLFTGGRISSSIAAAEARRSAREAGETQALQDIKLAVARRYVDVLRAERALTVADSNVATLQAYVADVHAMFTREAVPRNDLLAAEVALSNARQSRIRAENALSFARAAYNRQLGRPLAREIALDPVLPALDSLALDEPVERLMERALAMRSELAALDSQLESVQRQAQAERARTLPQVDLSASYAHLDNRFLDREDFAVAAIGFSWPVFDGGVTRQRTVALRRTGDALAQRRIDLESLIELEVRQTWLAVQETRSRLTATADAVEQSEENLRITRQQYLAGLVISTRVLEAETLRVQSHTNSDNARLDASLAEYQLARALGAL